MLNFVNRKSNKMVAVMGVANDEAISDTEPVVLFVQMGSGNALKLSWSKFHEKYALAGSIEANQSTALTTVAAN